MSRPHSVLVVEDESLIRMTVADALREAGFNVYEAADASQAITTLETHADIRLVFTDIDMPGDMDGIRFSQAVRERWPPVLLIITSGMRRPAAMELPTGAEFIEKPYVPEDVAEDVRMLLAA